MKRPRYIPESDDLIASRRAEQASSVQTERDSDAADRVKDQWGFFGLDWWDGSYQRRGVPESYSHLYDSPAGSSAEVAR